MPGRGPTRSILVQITQGRMQSWARRLDPAAGPYLIWQYWLRCWTIREDASGLTRQGERGKAPVYHTRAIGGAKAGADPQKHAQ